MKGTATRTVRPTEETSFRLRLQAELARRCSTNPAYSLRAFARDLEIDHSTLSQLLRGKRALTAPTIEALAPFFGLDAAAVDRYARFERSAGVVGDANEEQMSSLAHDAAELLSDWRHFAILELLRLRDFKPDSRWIARVLGASVDEVNLALHRLIRLGLLRMDAPDHWVDLCGDLVVSRDDFGQAAIQHLFEQVHRLALEAAREVPAEWQEHSSVTLAIDTNRLPEAIEKVQRFRREWVDRFSGGSESDAVYQLEIRFFPLTQMNRRHDDGRPGNTVADSLQEP